MQNQISAVKIREKAESKSKFQIVQTAFSYLCHCEGSGTNFARGLNERGYEASSRLAGWVLGTYKESEPFIIPNP